MFGNAKVTKKRSSCVPLAQDLTVEVELVEQLRAFRFGPRFYPSIFEFSPVGRVTLYVFFFYYYFKMNEFFGL